MRICLIGAGSMGSLYGGLLARSGEEITLLDPWREHVDAISRRGLHIDGIGGDFHVPVRAVTEAENCPPADVAIIQVNSYATISAATAARQVLVPGGYAITLQNGIGNVEILCEILGKDRVAAGLSYHSAALQGPGWIRHTHKGPTWLGELDGRKSERIRILQAVLQRAGFDPIVVSDIVEHIWSKFIHNCAINAISAITGLRVGEIPMSAEVDEFQTHIIDEVLVIVRAKGLRLSDPDPAKSIKEFCKKKFNKPSMLQHLEQGRRTEITALNGAVVREGRKLGIPTPYNEALSLLVSGREFATQQARRNPAIDYDDLEARANSRKGVGGHV